MITTRTAQHAFLNVIALRLAFQASHEMLILRDAIAYVGITPTLLHTHK